MSSLRTICFWLFIGCYLPSVHVKNAVSTPDPGFIVVGQSFRFQCVSGYIAKGQLHTCLQVNTLIPSLPDVTCYKEFTFPGDPTSWALVFRVQSGVGVNDYSAWYSSGTANELDENVGSTCESANKSNDCTNIYRTSIIDDWQIYSISKAKLAIFSNSFGLVRSVTFNATRTTHTGWFHSTRILSSSWTDMTPSGSYTIFSIAGGNSNRNFEITHSYNGCPNDLGWFLTTAYNGACSFDTHGSYPQIVYCTTTTLCIYETDTALADVYMVLIDASALSVNSP